MKIIMTFDMSDSGLYNDDGSPIPIGALTDPPHCWGANCNKSTDMNPGIGDPPYGFVCKLCGNSLRQHPFFGEGCEYDRGNTHRVSAWRALTNQEQAQVYTRYCFPVPKRLL